MVFNSLLVLTVADVSAEAWQHIVCVPDRISSQRLLDIIFCLPLQQLGRFAFCLWTIFCLPPPESYYYYGSDSDSDSDSDPDSSPPGYDFFYQADSHSD